MNAKLKGNKKILDKKRLTNSFNILILVLTMYPGLESYNPINESELDGIYQQTTSMLYSRDYQCAVKNDFRNERLRMFSS